MRPSSVRPSILASLSGATRYTPETLSFAPRRSLFQCLGAERCAPIAVTAANFPRHPNLRQLRHRRPQQTRCLNSH